MSPWIVDVTDRSLTTEVDHAVEALAGDLAGPMQADLPYACLASSEGHAAAEVTDGTIDGLRAGLAQAGPEGFVSVSDGGDIALAGNSSNGLANGLYALGRADRSGRALPDGVSTPRFELRDVYHFQTPWRMRGLSTDSFRDDEWIEHLDNIRRLGANRIYVDFWCSQYYHPDHPETHENRALYEVIRRAFDHAHRIGLRTGVFLFPCHTPTFVYERHPGARAVEVENYHGINMCWSRGRELIEPFDRHIFEFFGESLDDAVIELQDPGSCVCEACCDRFAEIVIEMMRLYRSWMGGGRDRRLDLCTLHFRDWLEERDAQRYRVDHPVPGLREKVFAALDRATVIHDIDADTIEMAHRFGLRTSHFFFDLDPECGLPDMTVFPRPKLARIPEQIGRSQERGDAGLLDYRLMPRTQFIADEVLLRMSWDTNLAVDEILADFAAELGLAGDDRREFVEATVELERYWGTGESAHATRSAELYASLPAMDARIARMADLVDVLRMMAVYREEHAEAIASDGFYPDAGFVEQVYQRMRRAVVFNAFTIDMHWEVRARECVGQHLRWWLRAIGGEVARAATGQAAW